MKLLFADPTPRWVPFVAAAMIVIGVWVASIWNGYDFATITRFSVGLACVLFVLIFFHGRYFWKGQVAKLSGEGSRYEAVTSIWVGRGKRVPFTPFEATNWRATTRNTSKDGAPKELATIYFTVKGQDYEMSFVNPKLVDLDALSALEPGFFAKLRTDYRALKSIAQ